MRDHRTGDVHHYDPALYDLLSASNINMNKTGLRIVSNAAAMQRERRIPEFRPVLAITASGDADHSIFFVRA